MKRGTDLLDVNPLNLLIKRNKHEMVKHDTQKSVYFNDSENRINASIKSSNTPLKSKPMVTSETLPLTPIPVNKRTTVSSIQKSDYQELRTQRLKSIIKEEIQKREQAEKRVESLKTELNQVKSALVHMTTLYTCASDSLKEYEEKERVLKEEELEEQNLQDFMNSMKFKSDESYKLVLDEDPVEIEIDFESDCE